MVFTTLGLRACKWVIHEMSACLLCVPFVDGLQEDIPRRWRKQSKPSSRWRIYCQIQIQISEWVGGLKSTQVRLTIRQRVSLAMNTGGVYLGPHLLLGMQRTIVILRCRCSRLSYHPIFWCLFWWLVLVYFAFPWWCKNWLKWMKDQVCITTKRCCLYSSLCIILFYFIYLFICFIHESRRRKEKNIGLENFPLLKL